MKRRDMWIGLCIGVCIILSGEAEAEEFVEFCGQKIELEATRFQCEDKTLDDLTPLKRLTKLKILDLTDTQVHNLTPLSELTELIALNLEGTQVSSLEALKAQAGQFKALKLRGCFKSFALFQTV